MPCLFASLCKKCSLEELFEKKLLFFLPFYIFSHEKELPECDSDETKLEQLKDVYKGIRTRLEDLQQAGEIDGFMKKAIYTYHYAAKSSMANALCQHPRCSRTLYAGIGISKRINHLSQLLLLHSHSDAHLLCHLHLFICTIDKDSTLDSCCLGPLGYNVNIT